MEGSLEHPDLVVGWTPDNPAPLLLVSFQRPPGISEWQFSLAIRQSAAQSVAEERSEDYKPGLARFDFKPNRVALFDLNLAFESLAVLRIQLRGFAADSKNEGWFVSIERIVTLGGQQVFKLDRCLLKHGAVARTVTGAGEGDDPQPSIVPEAMVVDFVKVGPKLPPGAPDPHCLYINLLIEVGRSGCYPRAFTRSAPPAGANPRYL